MRIIVRFALVFAGIACIAGAQAEEKIRFTRAAPVRAIGDTLAIEEPAAWHASMNAWLLDEHWRRPLDDLLALRSAGHAGDVNSLEEVVGSSWFTPADGRPSRSAAAPQFMIASGPLQILGARRAGPDPYLLVRDGRDTVYRLEFDDPSAPERRTAAVVILSRLLARAGYNTLECFVTDIAPADLSLDSHPRDYDACGGSDALTAKELQDFLARLQPADRVRVAASRLPRGVLKGSFSDRGTRGDDPNDTIAHEDRRALRGLWPLLCWLDHPGLRPDRCLDIYLQPQNYLRHYLVGFGGALSFLDPGKTAPADLCTWTPGYPFLPFERATYGDLYWGMETLMTIAGDDIRSAVTAARFSSNERAQFVAEALATRQAELARALLAHVNGVAAFRILDQGRGRWQLGFEDLGVRSGLRKAEQIRYEMTLIWPGLGESSSVQTRGGSGSFDLAPYSPPPGASQNDARRYAVATFRALDSEGRPLSGLARVHLRWDSGNGPEIAGLVRP